MIINPYIFAGGGGFSFGLASRDFDGTNDFVSLTPFDGTGIDGTSARSFAFWFKGTSTGGIICSYGTDSGTAARFRLEIAPAATFGRTIGGLTVEINGSLTCSSTVINTGSWVHVVVTYAAGTGLHTGTKIYINGSLSGRGDGGTNIGPNTTASEPFRIGRDLTAIGFLDGQLADFRSYASELSASDVSSIYAGDELSSNLIGWYFHNSDDVLDYSGEGNNGTNDGSTFSTDGPFD